MFFAVAEVVFRMVALDFGGEIPGAVQRDGGGVANAPKPIHKGFQPLNGMAVLHPPVGMDTGYTRIAKPRSEQSETFFRPLRLRRFPAAYPPSVPPPLPPKLQLLEE